MKHSPSLPRRALRGALALGAAAAASLALAGVASADVLVITPDSGGSDHLTAAITTANTNAAASNTIVLTPGQYLPAHQPITISKNLKIVADHAFQCPTGTGACVDLNGAVANAATQDNLFVVPIGVTLTLDGLNMDSVGATTFAGVQVNGTLKTYGVTFDGAFGWSVVVGGTGTANMTDTTFNSDLAAAVNNNNQMTLTNDTFATGTGTAINNGGTMTVTNTIVANNTGPTGPVGCTGNPPANAPAPGSISDVASCNFQHNSDPNIDSFVPFGDDGNGGPATTMDFTAGSPSHNIGVNCPTTDGRFFVNPGSAGARTCDAGAMTDGATQQTTAPSCVITSTAADRSSQTVTVSDAASGIGPQTNPVTDNPTNTPATAYPPPAAVPVPGYAVTNAQISNGTISAFMPFTDPSNNGVTITASKTTAGTPTRWSFTGMNWAGISKNCF